MSNSIKKVKFPYCSYRLLLKIRKMKESSKIIPIDIYDRAITILPEFVGFVFKVHNGKDKKKIVVNDNQVGHKFGEFSPTRVITKQTAQRLGLKSKK